MRNSPWYILFLLAIIGGAAGYVYVTSDVMTVQVTGKRVEVGQGRKRDFNLYVLDTDKGSFPILQFPVIGYFSGVDEIHAGIAPGSTHEVRIGQWPPPIVSEGRAYILSID